MTFPQRLGAALALLLAAGGAAAGAGAHYEGTSRDGLAVHVYLHGETVLGRDGTWQAIGVTVEATRGRRPSPAVTGCVYRYDEADRRAGRITCAARRSSPLSGVVWERDPRANADDPEAPMVCTVRCGRSVPARLLLDAHPDNH